MPVKCVLTLLKRCWISPSTPWLSAVSSINRPPPGGASEGRSLREASLEEPIRYAAGDPVEAWLNALLCLDAASALPPVGSCPHPSECELYHVERDALFSYHSASEAFLQRVIALCVASHYKNSPNDLQLMSDAPSHQLFVLLGPVDVDAARLPDVLAVVQIALEGETSRESNPYLFLISPP